MAMIVPMIFSSCSKDEQTTVLSGTTWESTEEQYGKVYLRWTLTFQGDSFTITVDEDIDQDGSFTTTDTASGTYSVDGNNITLNSAGLNMHGSFSDNVMNLDSGEDGGDFVYYKK